MNTETKLSFLSWNSNGLGELKKSVIKKHNCDVVFLQETHSCEREVLLDDYKSFYTTQTSSSTGVAILIKNNILEETSIVKQITDPAGCYIFLKCILKGQLFTLMSVYSCLIDIKPLLKLRSVLEEHAEGILLIGGDFNVALNPYLDTVSTKKNLNHIYFRPIVKELMASFHLVDVWRRFYPTDRQYSYQQKKFKSRLDYIFLPEESMQYIKKSDISLEENCSDHHQIVFKISICNEEYKEPEFCVGTTKETKTHILNFPMTAVNKWLSCKCKYQTEFDLTKDLNTSLKISASEVERAIQSLIVNHVKRPDGLPVSFYKSNSDVLIPYLCAFYHNILEQPTNIPEAFNDTFQVSENHYIFNVDYLILATIMARWLNDHLQSHSTDYVNGDNKLKTDEITQVLITFRKHPRKVEVLWSVLNDILKKEQDEDKRNTPLLDKFEINILQSILRSSPKITCKLLYWGCPLTPLLITLFFKPFADELVENVKKPTRSIHISRENVIVRFSVHFKTDLFEHLGKKYNVNCIEF